jgi:hypothetical protein
MKNIIRKLHFKQDDVIREYLYYLRYHPSLRRFDKLSTRESIITNLEKFIIDPEFITYLREKYFKDKSSLSRNKRPWFDDVQKVFKAYFEFYYSSTCQVEIETPCSILYKTSIFDDLLRDLIISHSKSKNINVIIEDYLIFYPSNEEQSFFNIFFMNYIGKNVSQIKMSSLSEKYLCKIFSNFLYPKIDDKINSDCCNVQYYWNLLKVLSIQNIPLCKSGFDIISDMSFSKDKVKREKTKDLIITSIVRYEYFINMKKPSELEIESYIEGISSNLLIDMNLHSSILSSKLQDNLILNKIINKIKFGNFKGWKFLDNQYELSDFFYKQIHDDNFLKEGSFSFYFNNNKKEMLNIHNRNDFCFYFTGFDSKGIVKLFYERTFFDNSMSFSFINKCLFLKSLNLERDVFFEAIKSLNDFPSSFSNKIYNEHFLELFNLLSEEYLALDIIKDCEFFSNDESYLSDSITMITNGCLSDHNFLKKLKKKVRKFHIEELHDKASFLLIEMGLHKSSLNQKDLFDKLNGMKLDNDSDLIISVPLTGTDLVSIGKSLNICVGSASYDEYINNGSIYVIALKDTENNFKYCISLSRKPNIKTVSLRECRGKSNEMMPQNLQDKLNILLMQKGMATESWNKFVFSYEYDSLDPEDMKLQKFPKECFFIKNSIGMNVAYYEMLFFYNVGSGFEERKVSVSNGQSPSWWKEKEDTFFIFEDYVLFIEGKFNER